MKVSWLRASDPILLVLAAVATVLGIFIVFDAGYARSIQNNNGLFPRECRSQMIFAAISMIIAFLCAGVRGEKWRRASGGLWILSLILVILVEVPGVGKEMNGARRWVGIGSFMIQPAEFAKIASVLLLASVFCRRAVWKPRQKRCRDWAQWLDAVVLPKLGRAWPALAVGFVALLIEREPDMGTAAVVLVILFAMCWFGGVSSKSLMAMVCLGVVGLGVMTIQEPYRMDRILNHADRWKPDHVDDVGYQTTQSETAMASGGFRGVGLGAGRAKHMLPAATTDFVMATVAEEFGLWGSLGVLCVLAAITFRLIVLAFRAETNYGRLVLLGTAAWIGIQSAVNLMMANGTLPAIGIPLPFISSGGSSLLALWIALGICQSVIAEKAPEKPKEEASVEAHRDRWRDGRTRLSRA